MLSLTPEIHAAVSEQVGIAQRSGVVADCTYSKMPAAVGFCIEGLCPASLHVLEDIQAASIALSRSAASAARPRSLQILEVGPGKGELIPKILALPGTHVTVVGEPHHVDHIVKAYGGDGRITGHAGWFPGAITPAPTEAFDFIYAIRVLHCRGVEDAKVMLRDMVSALVPGGRLSISTTSPWSSYYAPFWKDFAARLVDAGGEDNLDGFDVSESDMITAGRTAATVMLLTPKQAARLFRQAGLVDVEVRPFRMPRHPALDDDDHPDVQWDQTLDVSGTKPR